MPACEHSDLMTASQLADLLHVPELRLEKWRARRHGPAWFHLGDDRLVRYDRAVVEEWLAAQRGKASKPEPVVRPVLNPGGRVWRKMHDPADWQPRADGSWLSPSGRIYKGGSAAVQRVMAARTALGISNDPATTQEERG